MARRGSRRFLKATGCGVGSPEAPSVALLDPHPPAPCDLVPQMGPRNEQPGLWQALALLNCLTPGSGSSSPLARKRGGQRLRMGEALQRRAQKEGIGAGDEYF